MQQESDNHVRHPGVVAGGEDPYMFFEGSVMLVWERIALWGVEGRGLGIWGIQGRCWSGRWKGWLGIWRAGAVGIGRAAAAGGCVSFQRW